MFNLRSKKLEMPSATDALPGRANPIPTASTHFINGNALKVDLSPADVVTLYLLTSSNARLKPNLEKYLKPTARVVSLNFGMPGWKPARVETVQVDRQTHTIYIYEMSNRRLDK